MCIIYLGFSTYLTFWHFDFCIGCDFSAKQEQSKDGTGGMETGSEVVVHRTQNVATESDGVTRGSKKCVVLQGLTGSVIGWTSLDLNPV